MEFIRSLKQKQQIAQQNNIIEQAHSSICLEDFDNMIYIAYNGAPLIPVESNWTQKEILSKLEETRNSFIRYKQKQIEPCVKL